MFSRAGQMRERRKTHGGNETYWRAALSLPRGAEPAEGAAARRADSVPRSKQYAASSRAVRSARSLSAVRSRQPTSVVGSISHCSLGVHGGQRFSAYCRVVELPAFN